MRLKSAIVGTSLLIGTLVVAQANAADATTTRYEAEKCRGQCVGTIDTNWSGYSGTGFCNGDNASGAYAPVTVNAASAGTATLVVRFANGTTAARPADLIVNGARVQSVSFEGTGVVHVGIKDVDRQREPGQQHHPAQPTTASGLANLDYVELTSG